MARIFVVEDNEGLRETIASYLALEDHEVVAFSRLSGVEEAVRMQQPDLMILDVMLPDGDGFLLGRRLRAWSQMPIVFLSARSAESDRITGFEVGGDDYVVKPFSNKELMLRVAVLRRTQQSTADPDASVRWTLNHEGQDHTLELQVAGHLCRHDDHAVTFTAAEWRILNHLSENAGVVISRDRLLGACLDYLAEGSERTIDTHIKNTRLKLSKLPWIETVRGFGYRFAGVEEPRA